jgi:hypothetical protein
MVMKAIAAMRTGTATSADAAAPRTGRERNVQQALANNLQRHPARPVSFLLGGQGMPIAFSLQDGFNLTSIIGISIGACWAVYTWWHQERLRRIKDDPGLAIGIKCKLAPLPDGRVLMTVDCSVGNTGVMPIFPEAERASFRIGHIPACAATGFLTRETLVEDVQETVYGPRIKGLRLEPKTETVFSAQYLAAPGLLYAVAFTLPSQRHTRNGKPWDWSKWRAVYVPKPTMAEVQDSQSLIAKPADVSSRSNNR